MTTDVQQPATRRRTGRHLTAPLRALVAAGTLALARSAATTVSADPAGSANANAAGQAVAAVATQTQEGVTPGVGEQTVALLVPAVQKVREAALKLDGIDGESCC